MRILLLLLLAACGLQAEIQLWLTRVTVNEVTTPMTPAQQGTQVQFPDIRENDLVDARFEIRNPGGPDTSIANLKLVPKTDVCGTGGGTAFILMLSPTNPPGTLGANGTYAFEVRYLPPKPQCYEAYLAVAQRTYVLRGSASGRTVMFEIDTLGQRQIINGSSSDFGNVRVGEAYTKSYRITNSTGATVVIAPPVLTGAAGVWTLVDAPESNRTVPTNGNYEFKVRFAPNRDGLINGSFTVDGRVINLVGMGLPGAVPDFDLQPSATDVDSASQSEVRITLKQAAAVAVSGTLTLIFEKELTSLPDDESIRFIENGARSIAFRVNAGETKARFGDGNAEVVRFQTGAALGRIRLVATLSQWEHSAVVNIRADATKLSSGAVQRTGGQLSVQVAGLDNTRSVSAALFRFFDADGRAIGNAAGVEVPVSDIFTGFFSTHKMGGVFTLRAVFPVQGDVNGIARVEVLLRNKLGLSQALAVQ